MVLPVHWCQKKKPCTASQHHPKHSWLNTDERSSRLWHTEQWTTEDMLNSTILLFHHSSDSQTWEHNLEILSLALCQGWVSVMCHKANFMPRPPGSREVNRSMSGGKDESFQDRGRWWGLEGVRKEAWQERRGMEEGKTKQSKTVELTLTAQRGGSWFQMQGLPHN